MPDIPHHPGEDAEDLSGGQGSSTGPTKPGIGAPVHLHLRWTLLAAAVSNVALYAAAALITGFTLITRRDT